ncbi:MAG: polynucleotide adenylyltransferase PcnB [Candidatus Rariloculaceae bacterium]
MNDTDSQSHPGPNIITRSGHSISRANISNNAIKVLYRLNKAGYQAFLVGGGVRDLLLELNPKDFDIATDAKPEEVRALFRNCRLIGRRFRLAHVHFGREIIEVVTFRAAETEEHQRREQADSGRILRDNVYGSIEEDIWRRDFTVNALYYNIADFTIWDYTTGMADIADRKLRLIGDPETRYREDPVRMLRAARFAAKLGFEVAKSAASPIRDLGKLLRDVPPARLFDETLKLFQSGHAVRSLELLLEFDLLKYLFPNTADSLTRDSDGSALQLLRAGLANTDRRVKEELPITPMFLYAVLLWQPICERSAQIFEKYEVSEIEALLDACDEIVSEQQGHTGYPKRFSVPMKDMLVMQKRFQRRRGIRAQRLLSHKRFRAAYDFLLLRAQCGEEDQELADWWTEVQTMSNSEQRKAFGVGKRRSRRRSSAANSNTSASG